MTAHTPTLHPWRPLYWEPVAGTGERLMVGLVYRYDNQWKASRILRDDVLANLYGNAAGGTRKLIDFGLSLFHAAAQAGNSLEPWGSPWPGCTPATCATPAQSRNQNCCASPPCSIPAWRTSTSWMKTRPPTSRAMKKPHAGSAPTSRMQC